MLEGKDGTGGRLRTLRYLAQHGERWNYVLNEVQLVPGTFFAGPDSAHVAALVNEQGTLYEKDGRISDSYNKIMRITYYFIRFYLDGEIRWLINRCEGVKSCDLDGVPETAIPQKASLVEQEQTGKTWIASRSFEESAESYILKGIAYVRMHKYAAAIEQYQKALVLAPNDARIHDYMSYAEVRSGNFTDAVEQSSRALALDSRLADSHFNRATALEKLGRSTMAAEDYREAIRLYSIQGKRDSVEVACDALVQLVSLDKTTKLATRPGIEASCS